MEINLGAKRLGQDGPHDRSNQDRFPPDKYRTVMCGGFRDYAHQHRQLAPVLSPLAGRADGHRQHDGGERLIRALPHAIGRKAYPDPSSTTLPMPGLAMCAPASQACVFEASRSRLIRVARAMD